ATLGKVVGADALGTVARADQQLATVGDLLVGRGVLLVLQLGRQPGHGLGAVLVLRALFLAFDHDAGGQVGDADGRFGLVDVLATGAGGAIGVHAQVGRVDLDGVLLIRLGQHRHGAGRGVDAALGFGFRHALHAVRAGFEFQLGKHIVTLDAGDDFLVAAMLAGVFREDLDAPALLLGVTRIHAEQVAGEDRRLVAAGAGAHFQEHVAAVVGVARQQHALQAVLEGFQLGARLLDLFLGHGAQLRITVLEHFAGAFEVGLHLAEIAVGEDDRLHLGIFLGIGAELVLVGDHLGVAEQRGELLVTVL